MSTKEPVEVKVTRLKGFGYGVIISLHGKLWCQRVVADRIDVGPSIRSDLRMIDKCGGPSRMASASRVRNYCTPHFNVQEIVQ